MSNHIKTSRVKILKKTIALKNILLTIFLLYCIGCQRYHDLSQEQPLKDIVIADWKEFTCNNINKKNSEIESALIRQRIDDIWKDFLHYQDADSALVILKDSVFSLNGNDFKVDGQIFFKKFYCKSNTILPKQNKTKKKLTGFLINVGDNYFSGILNGDLVLYEKNQIVCSAELKAGGLFVCWISGNKNIYNISEYSQKVYDGTIDFFQIIWRKEL